MFECLCVRVQRVQVCDRRCLKQFKDHVTLFSMVFCGFVRVVSLILK